MCSPPLNPKPKHGSTRKRRERARAGESRRASHGKSRAVAVCGIHVKRGRALVTVTHPIDVKRCTPPACAHPLPSVTLERAAQTATLSPRHPTPDHLRPANTPPPPFLRPANTTPPPSPPHQHTRHHPPNMAKPPLRRPPPPTHHPPVSQQHTPRLAQTAHPLAPADAPSPLRPPHLIGPPLGWGGPRAGGRGGRGLAGGRTPPPARRAPGFDQSKGWLSVLNWQYTRVFVHVSFIQGIKSGVN